MIARREFNRGLTATGLATLTGGAYADVLSFADPDVTRLELAGPVVRLAFGSCNHQGKSQDFWPTIQSFDPHLFICVGDLVYPKKSARPFGDTEDAFRYAFRRLNAQTGSAAFRRDVPFFGIWDDNAVYARTAFMPPTNLGRRAVLYSLSFPTCVIVEVPGQDTVNAIENLCFKAGSGLTEPIRQKR